MLYKVSQSTVLDVPVDDRQALIEECGVCVCLTVSERDEAETAASAKVESTTEPKFKSVGTFVISIVSTRMAESHQRAHFEIHLLNQRFETDRITKDYCM